MTEAHQGKIPTSEAVLQMASLSSWQDICLKAWELTIVGTEWQYMENCPELSQYQET